jgi:uncharacterized lipoprotein NlpE involved in copper resistance/heat shock protein HslJ
MNVSKTVLMTLLVMMASLLLAACDITPPPAPTAPAESTPQQPTQPDLDPAVGIYKGFFVAASSPGIDSTLYINFDGTLRLESDYLNGEPAIVETGEWMRDEGGLLLLTTADQEISALLTETGLMELTEERMGRVWIDFVEVALGNVALPYNLEAAAEYIQAQDYVGIYKALLPAASCCGLDMTLILAFDGSAILENDYLNGEPAFVEMGSWTAGEEGVFLTLTGSDRGDYDQAVVWSLVLTDGRLVKPSVDGSLPVNFYEFGALAMPISPDPLAGTAWQLQSILMMDDTVLTPEDSGSYRLEFLADGEMAGQVDCNLVGGSYTVDGPALSFGQMRMTLAACPDSIVTDRFLQGLNDANSYVLADGLLNIAFGPDSGILVMEPAE